MPEIRDYYVYVKDLDIAALHQRKNDLLAGKLPGEYRDLDDDALAELLAITRELRKRAAVSPKRANGGRKPKTPKDKESLDALI